MPGNRATTQHDTLVRKPRHHWLHRNRVTPRAHSRSSSRPPVSPAVRSTRFSTVRKASSSPSPTGSTSRSSSHVPLNRPRECQPERVGHLQARQAVARRASTSSKTSSPSARNTLYVLRRNPDARPRAVAHRRKQRGLVAAFIDEVAQEPGMALRLPATTLGEHHPRSRRRLHRRRPRRRRRTLRTVTRTPQRRHDPRTQDPQRSSACLDERAPPNAGGATPRCRSVG